MPSRHIRLAELKAWIDQRRDFVLIDTGLQEDFQAVRLPQAQNACVFEVTFLAQVAALNGVRGETPGASPKSEPRHDATIVVYGASERSLASATAAEKLVAAGYESVFEFRGGLAEWQAAGEHVEGSGVSTDPPALEDRAYAVDPEQSMVGWVGRSLVGTHSGTMALLPGGTITLHGARVVAGRFDLDMASIRDVDLTDTKMKQMLHDHLASDDFFDVARYPTASFQLEGATEIAGATPGEPNYTVRGRFTLKGVKKPLAFQAMIGRSPTGDGSLVARANFDLDRTEWNVLYGSGKFYEKLGRNLVSDLITLDLKIVAR